MLPAWVAQSSVTTLFCWPDCREKYFHRTGFDRLRGQVFLKKGFKGAKSSKHNERDVALSDLEHNNYYSFYCGCQNALSATGTN